jgi:hypothetical protein
MTYSESKAYYEQQAKDQHLTERQRRCQGMDPLPSWPSICSAEQDKAIADAQAASVANAQDPLLDGADSLRRLREHDGYMA